MSLGVGASIRKFRRDKSWSQEELAVKLGVSRSALVAWEKGRNKPGKETLEALQGLGYNAEVGAPAIPGSEPETSVPYIGYISASSKADWTDPFESDDFEYVPSHMVESRGRFACRVESDSMMPLLQPDDLCLWQSSRMPKLNTVVLYRHPDRRLTIKQLKHDGQTFVLHPLNPAYQDEPALGEIIGHLVGVVRRMGKRTITDYDPDGIRL